MDSAQCHGCLRKLSSPFVVTYSILCLCVASCACFRSTVTRGRLHSLVGFFFPVRQQHVEVYILNMWTYNEVATETGLLLAMDHFLLHDNQCLAC